MKTLFAYFPVEGSGYLCLSQNRFAKFRGDLVLIYPIIPASGLTLWKREGYEVYYIDPICDKLSVEEFLNRIEKIKPDLIVYETKTPVVKRNWKVVELLKERLKNVKIAAVGDHVSVLPEETMENSKVDYVLTGGDFDVSMLKLAKFLDGKGELPKGTYYRDNGIKNNGKYELINNLDEIPFIDRDIIPWKKYFEGWRLYDEFMYLMGSRGCPYKCSFCSWPAMLNNYSVRFRSVNNVLDELEMLIEKYKIKEVFFDDDTFTCNKKWVLDFCNGIVERKLKILWSCNGRVDNTDYEMLRAMKKSGCRLIKYGIESGNQKTLDKIKKNYTLSQVRKAFMISRKLGILRHGTVMIGYPWESKEEIRNTINFVKSLSVDTVQFSIPIVYPGTELFKEAEKKRWLAFGYDWDKYDMSLPTLRHPRLSAEEIVDLCSNALKEVYFQPKFIFHKVASIRKPSHLKWIVRGTKTVLKGHIGELEKRKKIKAVS